MAGHFANRFPGYSAAERDSFLAIAKELNRIVQEVLAEVRNGLGEDQALPDGPGGAASAGVVAATGT